MQVVPKYLLQMFENLHKMTENRVNKVNVAALDCKLGL